MPAEGRAPPDPVKVATDLLALAELAADPMPLIAAARAILHAVRAEAKPGSSSQSVASG